MNHVEIYSKDPCPYCDRAKSLLDSKGVSYDVIDIGHDETLAMKMMQLSQQRTVPQVVINNKSIGGYDALAMLNAKGDLDRLLGLKAA